MEESAQSWLGQKKHNPVQDICHKPVGYLISVNTLDTEYLSLEYPNRLSADKLKVEPAFVSVIVDARQSLQDACQTGECNEPVHAVQEWPGKDTWYCLDKECFKGARS